VRRAIEAVVPPTPQFSWPLLNARAGCEVWVKHENHTAIGSFKIRGALNLVRLLAEREPSVRGVVAATRGNYGQAVAFAAGRVGVQAVIVVPRGNSPEKNRAMRSLGAELIEHGDDFQAALVRAGEVAAERGLRLLPPFHPDLARGIAVSMLDFLRACPPLDRVYVPVGMGSGICALAAARDALGLETSLIGAGSAGAPAHALSFEAGRVVVHPAGTRIADGVATSTPDPAALGFILAGAGRFVRVTDDDAEGAMRAYFEDTHNVAEGAAGVALAALLAEREGLRGRRAGVILTGGNVDAAVFARVIAGGAV
jgi:threonine dehydratase